MILYVCLRGQYLTHWMTYVVQITEFINVIAFAFSDGNFIRLFTFLAADKAQKKILYNMKLKCHSYWDLSASDNSLKVIIHHVSMILLL